MKVLKLGIPALVVFASLMFVGFAYPDVGEVVPSDQDETVRVQSPCSVNSTLDDMRSAGLSVNSQFYNADLCDAGWEVGLEGSLGTETQIKVKCTSGGGEDCPLLTWC